MKQLTSLLGLFGALAASVALDLEFLQLRKIAGRSFNFAPLLWAWALIPLVWGALIGLLAWWVLFRSGRNVAVLAVFIVVGLLVTLMPVIYLTGAIPSLPPQFVDVGSSTIALTAHTGVLSVVIGVAGLIWRREPA